MRAPPVGIIFHGIGNPRRPVDPGEMPYWVSESQFSGLLDRIAALSDPGRVRISFDDGNLSDLDIALPALLARNMTADFFVLIGRIGTPGSLSAADILALQDAGMTIGSHGIAHVNWRSLDDAGLHRELTRSKADLEALCGRRIDRASIPFGAFDARVLWAIRRAGYAHAYCSEGGRMRPQAFLQPRASVRGNMTAAEIDDLFTGRIPARRRRRLLFYSAFQTALMVPRR